MLKWLLQDLVWFLFLMVAIHPVSMVMLSVSIVEANHDAILDRLYLLDPQDGQEPTVLRLPYL